MKKYISFFLFCILGFSEAQADSGTDSLMYSNGKFYVVVAVIIIMFIGIVAYLMHLDRKLTKLENQINYDD